MKNCSTVCFPVSASGNDMLQEMNRMSEYQKVIRGRGSLNKLPVLMKKLSICRPMIVGMEPLITTLLKKNPVLVPSPVFSAFHTNPDLTDTEAGADIFKREKCY